MACSSHRFPVSAPRPSRLLAAGANAVAATILGLTLVYGLRFVQTPHVDSSSAITRPQQWFLFIGEGRVVDVARWFCDPHGMILALAIGGIMAADFTIWAYAQAEACLDRGVNPSADSPPSTKPWRTRWRPGRAHGGRQDPAERDDGRPPPGQREASSTLLLAVTAALCCASALALFAPHKTMFEQKSALWSFPSTRYRQDVSMSPDQTAVTKQLSQFLMESTSTRSEAVEQAIRTGEEYDRTLPGQGPVRVGDILFPGLRTRGIGVNVASFEGEPFLSQHFPTKPEASGWSLAPDYKLQGLDATVYGTDVHARCKDVTSEMHTAHRATPNGRDQINIFSRSSISGVRLGVFHSSEWWPAAPITSSRITKGHPWNMTVFQCEFHGSETLTSVVINPISKALNMRSYTNVSDLDPGVSRETAFAVSGALMNGRQSPETTLFLARQKMDLPTWGILKSTYSLEVQLVEDILTDTAQAYWSLVRQKIETAADLCPAQTPFASGGIRTGQVRGSYIRLGGAGWGLIMPGLMILLPTVALFHLACSAVSKMRFGLRTGRRQWQVVPQSDDRENELVYTSPLPVLPSLPLSPPPKDNEPAPPYTVHA